ncbi:endonuclease/exonuclease/phosphatase family protein [Streptomyces sp. NBC_00986]|uniref:endonuclease/exonuclease/phosphatase family protein n=1 Tax=Streptomyces sp. NBC_00986 TaxID=2903702 RepID=UPI00386912E0|nr:endonuclease/exonuclease/phosphatase family protein [Streptomyces sp. NBC_00986]
MGELLVRCATFNVLHGRQIQPDGRPNPVAPGDLSAPLAEAVASLDADVVALQEIDCLQERSGGVDQAAVAADAMGARDWRYATALHCRSVPGRGWVPDPTVPGMRVYGPGAQRPEVPSHGLALLSRLPVHEWRALRLPAAPFGMPLRVAGRAVPVLARDQPRAALAAVLEGPHGPFTVVAVHLSFVPGWNIGQLRTVRRWIADLPQPRVLMGDFNLFGALPRITLDGMGRRRWQRSARQATFPSHRPLVQLDHVMATGLGADAVGEVCVPRTAISDHRPLVVELAL